MTTEDRYPGANILSQRGHWDEATRRVVLDRVYNTPAYKHFNPQQQAILVALCNRVIPQEHIQPEKHVQIAPWIDQSCASQSSEGFRFDNMPSLAEAWDRGLEGLDQTAQRMFGAGFAALTSDQQDQVLEAVRAGNPPGEIWKELPAHRWWIYTALRQITGFYYAHPYAWDEIGFGGPAYPRGYFALNDGAPEPWEPREKGEQSG